MRYVKHLLFLTVLFGLLALIPLILTVLPIFNKYPLLGIIFPAIVLALAFGLTAYWVVLILAKIFPTISKNKN
jgi:hypothetical protein